MTKTMVVYTTRGKTEILETKGSQAWRLKKERAENYKYLVCVQNRNTNWGSYEAPHQEAFLIAEIDEIKKVSEKKNARWIIMLKSYAEISIPNQWDGNRNPVSYQTLEEIGIDINTVNFTPIPETRSENKPLTIQEAKKGLALGLGIDESAIEITIKL